MVDIPALRGEMAKHKISQAKMAEILKITPKTFYSKMQTGNFGVDEAMTISETLNLENPVAIFFAKE
jgi:DNA-binding XRE family transcriptional regulator